MHSVQRLKCPKGLLCLPKKCVSFLLGGLKKGWISMCPNSAVLPLFCEPITIKEGMQINPVFPAYLQEQGEGGG
jgi:hypothetical protein